MMMKTTSLLTMLALAGFAAVPLDADAQGTRSTAPVPTRRATPATAPAPPPAGARVAATRNWTDEEYKLGPGDKLRIEVYGQPQASQNVQIRPDGKITLPLIGDVTASGLTPTALRDSVTTSLKQYFTNPVVTAIVQEAVSAQISIIGEVANPGPQILSGPLTVLEALSAAGGLGEFAKKGDIAILRRSSGQRIPFDYKDAVNGKIGPVYLEPGDLIIVP